VRQIQASRAFGVRGALQEDAVYLLVDDVVTTGATFHHGTKALFEAGAGVVWAAAIARQPLD
jgi:predicted amidophosphoribosyltransferase